MLKTLSRTLLPILALTLASPTGFAATTLMQISGTRAMASPIPWAGYWWPYTDGGISNNQYGSGGMSPAGKHDAVTGWNASGWESYYHGPSVGPADWWGHCNGWATAAIMEPEPRAGRVIGGINFDVSDRKALLTEYWQESGADFYGTRVDDPNDTSSYAFWDVTPAQFHQLMTNYLLNNSQSVIIDRHTGAEVWNQPLVAVEFDPVTPDDYLGPDPEHGNIYRANLTATIWWANDEVEPGDLTRRFEWKEDEYFSKRTLRYELWLDAPLEFDAKGKLIRSGNVVLTDSGDGGRWMNGTSYEELINSHPDFIWVPLSYASGGGSKNPNLNDSWIHANLTD